jgi:hypothetical protein
MYDVGALGKFNGGIVYTSITTEFKQILGNIHKIVIANFICNKGIPSHPLTAITLKL